MSDYIYVAAVRVINTEPFNVAHELSYVPQKFGPHITLKGRFSTTNKPALRDVMDLLSGLSASLSCVRLSPWMSINQNLVWRECLPTYDGYKSLCKAHAVLVHYVKQRGCEDLTPEAFQGSRFRPHMTIKWNDAASHVSRSESAGCTCTGKVFIPALYRYVGDPFSSEICEVFAAN